jgi:hypothetical protein
MKLFARTFALLAALCAFNANANVFTFSYTFTDTSTVTNNISGTLSGDLNGAFVDNISNIHVLFNDVAFTGTLMAGAFDATGAHFDTGLTARLSTDAALNNFVFTDAAGVDNALDNWFAFVNTPATLDQQVFANNFSNGDFAFDNPANASWQLTAVPEPANLALFATGLGLLSLTVRRRKQR